MGTTAALPDGIRAFFEGDRIWLLDARTAGPCPDCLRLWRAWRWQDAPAEAPDSPDGLPVAELMIGLQAACLAGLPPLPDDDAARLRSIDATTGAARDHVLMRHAGCPSCPSPPPAGVAEQMATMPPGPLRSRTLEDLARMLLPMAVDSDVGIVRWVARRTDLRMAATATALINSKAGLLQPEHGHGRSGERVLDPAIAAIEAIERFAGAEPGRRDREVRASFAEIADQAIDPALFILPNAAPSAQDGHALKPYDPDLPMAWTPAWSLRRNANVLVPTQIAYYGAPANDLPAGRFLVEVSNGCAAGGSLAEAILFGLMEVIERDAFLVSWHAGRRLQPYAAAQTPDPGARAMLARLQAEGLEVTVLDIGCGLPGCSVAVSVADPDQHLGAALVCAAASHVDPDRALRSALNEVLTMKSVETAAEQYRRRARAAQLLADPRLVRTMDDHVTQAWSRDGAQAKSFRTRETVLPWAQFPGTGGAPLSGPDLLAHYIDGVLAEAHDILVIDQSPPPLAARGLHMVKVLAPGLLPMTFGHDNRRLDWARIARFAEHPADMHDHPHIFP
jgi:ribosomal protein S12 methylthiotransferase accessory factor